MLGLLSINFNLFITELWPLSDVRILYLLNILRTNRWNLTKFCMYIDTESILVGIVTHQFSQINNRIIAIDCCQNFVSAQYFEDN